jgi:hypothetical protein
MWIIIIKISLNDELKNWIEIEVMVEINFENIRRNSSDGQRGGFEGFVCQLARHHYKPSKGNFRRVEGSGGDGGVEAYWQFKDGTKIGYQAKFWLRSSEIDWGQIDQSVAQALKTHPELSNYIIAIPCDLTGRSGAKARGKRGWDHWESHKEGWEALAASLGMTVNFIPWTKSEMIDLSNTHLPSGAIKYWFNSEVLTETWFRENAERAITDLGLRYQPKYNVDTSISRFFDSFCKNKDLLEEMESMLNSETQNLMWTLDDFDKIVEDDTLRGYLNSFREQLENLISACDEFVAVANLDILFDWNEFSQKQNSVIDDLFHIHEQIRQSIPEPDYSLPEEKDKKNREFHQMLHGMGYDIQDIWEAINEESSEPYGATCFALSGSFGEGKSHALGRFIETQIKNKSPAILLLGQQFSNIDPRQQILEKLDCPHLSFSEFLEAMNSASEMAGKIGIIAIDALNEGAGLGVWKDHLAGLLTDIEKHDHLRLIFSYRMEYENQLIPENVKERSYTYQIKGFDDDDEFEQACVVLMDELKIQRPTSPFLPPAFTNPLFLTQICQRLHENGESTFPDGLDGMSALMDYYHSNVAGAVQRQYQLSDSVSKPIRSGFEALAKKMAEEKTLWVKRGIAEKILQNIINLIPPVGKTWLQVLLETGFLRADPSPDIIQEPFTLPEEVIKFSFQAFEEYLIANELWKPLNKKYDGIFDQSGPLGFLINHENNLLADYSWNGVLMALGVILGESGGTELIDVLPYELTSSFDGQRIQEQFESGIYWRSANSITNRTVEILQDNGPDSIFEFLCTFSLAKKHSLNSHALHHMLTEYGSMAERDSIWTKYINTHSEYETTLTKRLDWLTKHLSNIDDEIAELSAIFISWQFSSTRIPYRNRSTNILTNLFIQYPEVMPATLQFFKDVDDLYIQERLYFAVYGACHFIDAKFVKLIAEDVYNIIFCGDVPLHILLRDSAQCIIERAKFLNALPDHIDINLCMPPWKSTYSLEFHSNQEIDDLAKSLGENYGRIAHSCVTEHGRGISEYGDFGRYVLEVNTNYFSRFTLDSVLPEEPVTQNNHDGELIGNWVAYRAYNYGWSRDRFPDDDSVMNNRDKNQLERIGKKYQWIAMYELLGMLADHCYVTDSVFNPSTYKTYSSIEDVPYCRIFDPTLLKIPNNFSIPELDSKLPKVSVPEVKKGEEKIQNWLNESDRLTEFQRDLIITDKNKNEWVLVYHFLTSTEKGGGAENSDGMKPRISVFSRLSAHISKNKDREIFLKENQNCRQSDPSSPMKKHPDYFGVFQYLYERDWRNLDVAPVLDDDYDPIPPNSMLVDEYRYSSHNDSNFPDGYTTYLPISSIISQQQLSLDREYPNIFRNTNNQIVFYTSKEFPDYWNGFNQIWLRKDVFDQFLNDNDLCCVWVAGGEKDAILGGRSTRKRNFSELIWFDKGKRKEKYWSDS